MWILLPSILSKLLYDKTYLHWELWVKGMFWKDNNIIIAPEIIVVI